jgi:hypothetical protein
MPFFATNFFICSVPFSKLPNPVVSFAIVLKSSSAAKL